MKKFLNGLFKGLCVFVLLVTIAILGFSLYGEKVSLETAQSQIESMSFKEGTVVESEKGGTVTANLNTWIYFQDDSFVTETKPNSSPLKEIFCNLHKANLVDSFKDNLVKLDYTKQIIVKTGDVEKTYYLVGDYYITSSK